MSSMDPRRGLFISVEGGEGVGKSTLLRSLQGWLRTSDAQQELGVEHGGTPRDVVLTREPGGTPTADMLRAVFTVPAAGDPLTVMAEFLVVSAARAQHVERVIKPALAKGTLILCDRFVDSSRVYQGTIGGVPGETLEVVSRIATGGLEPDITLLLDCSVAESLRRLAARWAKNEGTSEAASRFDKEKESFHERLRLAYLDLGKRFSERIVVLDAAVSAERLLAAAREKIVQRATRW